MGLDITAHRKISKIDPSSVVDGCPMDADGNCIDYDLAAWVNGDFPGREGSVSEGYYYSEESFGFGAGAYGGYNSWRNELARIAGYPEGTYEGRTSYCVACWNGETGPFSELINFSDCEGVIGPQVSAKLVKDFSAFDAAAQASNCHDFYSKYQEWKRAFEMGADDGAVSFR